MRYRIVPLLLAGALLLTGCAARTGDQEPEETVVVYKALALPDLLLDIPEGYEETSSQFLEKFYIKDDATIIVTEDNEKGKMTSWDYSIDALNQYQKITNTLDMLGDEVVYAGTRAVQILEFTYTLEEGSTPMSSMVGYSTDGSTMYIVTCKCHADTYESHRGEFLTVMQSMRVDKGWIGASERAAEKGQ